MPDHKRRRPPRRLRSIEGQQVPYDTTASAPRDWEDGGDPEEVPEPGSFNARVISRRVDLVALIRTGIPPREYHAHSAGMFVRGKRITIAAPRKSGKSLACLAHWVRMVLAGERVAILDRENGGDEYSRRLDQIMDAWQLGAAERDLVAANLIYIEHPRLRRGDYADLVRYFAEELAVDLVCFDSQRMFLSDFGLKEKDSDDYTTFMDQAVDPLAIAGVTTVTLDNTGHGDQKRGRGTASKGDLNEILFYLEGVVPFDKATTGEIKLVIDDSRFGDSGSWTMQIGGGVFGEWRSSADRVAAAIEQKPDFPSAVIDALKTAGAPMGASKLLNAVRERGIKFREDEGREMVKAMNKDPSQPVRYIKNRGYRYAG